MSAKTSIEWTDATWNPTRGCSRVSEGCRNCYAERIAARFSAQGSSGLVSNPQFAGFAVMSDYGPRWTGKVELVPEKLNEPLHWRKPRRVFVNSMSDLFHENLPYPDILHVFQTMAKCRRHTFQILTKRPAKMLELLSLCWWRNLGHSPAIGGDHWVKVIAGEQRPGDQNFLPNVWLGVSVEDQATADERIPLLLQTPAAIRFVSYEPALGPVDFRRWIGGPDKDGHCVKCGNEWPDPKESLEHECPPGFGPPLDWIIAGGESGPGARPAAVRWFQSVRQQCQAAGVAFFMKQMGTNCTDSLGRMNGAMFDRKGENLEMFPPDLQVREFPSASSASGPAQLSTTRP